MSSCEGRKKTKQKKTKRNLPPSDINLMPSRVEKENAKKNKNLSFRISILGSAAPKFGKYFSDAHDDSGVL